MADVLDIADRFFAAVESSDIAAVDACYRDDVEVWHNFDDAVQTKTQNLETLGSIPQRYESFGYTEPRVTALPDGFLRQHVIVAGRNGKIAHVPAILRVYVDDAGLISRIEEYFDYGQLTSQLRRD